MTRLVMRRIMLGLLVFVWGAGVGFAAERVEYVGGRDYFSVAQREISRARSSIVVGLYLFSFRPEEAGSPVMVLAESLVRAHRAGVKVEVLLDQNVNYVDGEPFDPIEGKNAAAYAYLKAAGVPVFYDSASTYTHSKIVVIDGETVILGSSNWSFSAFNKNEEANVLIRSTDVARKALAALAAIPRVDPVIDESGSVAVPGEFLVNPDLLARMVSAPDERAFDVYLYVLKQSTPSFVLDYQTCAVALGIGGLDRLDYRRQINKTFLKLQEKYGLVRFRTGYGQDLLVERVGLDENHRKARVPERYWSWGWDRRLSFAGKCFYLVSCYESEVSTLRPRWSVAQSTLARRYGGAGPFWGTGVTDLRRWNLLEADYAPYSDSVSAPRQPTVYTPNALYDMSEFDKKIDELKATYGSDAVDRARRAAAVVYEDHDIHGINELLELDRQYGAKRLAEAVRVVQQKNPDNPHRSMAYLIGVVRGMKE